MHRQITRHIIRRRIYQVNFCITASITKQTCCRINIKRRSNNDNNISFTHSICSQFNHRNSLTKPNDEWTQLTSIGCLITYMNILSVS